jgi:predicted nucleotidyltransferase
MAKTQPSPFPFPPKRMYWGANIPMRVIRRYARAIAEEFHPNQIILFGSHAYGTPHEDSDVDLLVVMPARNHHNQAVRILWRLAAPFPLDLIVRTPKELKWRLEEGESFTTTILFQGRVLYRKRPRGSGSRRPSRITCSPSKEAEAKFRCMTASVSIASSVPRSTSKA